MVAKFYLDRAMESDPNPEIHAGGSGYFSRPEKVLDPNLFDGDRLKPEVRSFILDTLYSYWGHKYSAPKDWSTVWIAGSGASYQWAADRSNGDLDILIGVDFNAFDQHNPGWTEIPEGTIADIFNQKFHEDLWPKTDHTKVGNQYYQVTFYCNPGSKDIKDIHPYAAYNVTTDEWTVRPPVLPDDPHTLYPAEYYKAAEATSKQAKELIRRYGTLKAQAEAMPENSPGRLNALSAQSIVVSQAKSLFDTIHLGRKEAFSKSGAGYGDYHNFLWQSTKNDGTAQALHSLATVSDDAQAAAESDLYGQPLKSATVALTEALLRGRV